MHDRKYVKVCTGNVFVEALQVFSPPIQLFSKLSIIQCIFKTFEYKNKAVKDLEKNIGKCFISPQTQKCFKHDTEDRSH